jgi:hypothetical protein
VRSPSLSLPPLPYAADAFDCRLMERKAALNNGLAAARHELADMRTRMEVTTRTRHK